ncbi:helix-turn-helix domain-containing protein [Clostridium sp. HMP27]|uniref:helix-turn-helix domain-containing protein n=1 Tax=Clostridium sp. HMP27 TaxID=1487921 RepID=UPI00068C425A|nr:helix-turn-helix domain-containing protein [Clostridium sp. HMP27]
MADKGQVKEAYETGKYTFQQLADEFNVSLGTIKSWAKRDKDDGKPWLKGCNQKEKDATKKSNKVATKKKVTEDKKEKILALSAIGKSQREVAEVVGVAPSTVNRIVNINPDDLEQYRTQKKMEFIQQAWDTVNNALAYGNQKIILATVMAEHFDDKIDELIEVMKSNGADGKTVGDTIKAISQAMNIPLRDVATYVGTLYDKIALATGGATANVNLNANVTPTREAMKEMSLEELRRLAKLE